MHGMHKMKQAAKLGEEVVLPWKRLHLHVLLIERTNPALPASSFALPASAFSPILQLHSESGFRRLCFLSLQKLFLGQVSARIPYDIHIPSDANPRTDYQAYQISQCRHWEATQLFHRTTDRLL